jgi:hypothetical protein
MNESLFEELIEISWRRRLTPEEEVQLQSWLASHPADAERWEAEAGLNLALERLKTVEPSSNFTSQVLRLVELEQAQIRQQQHTVTFGEKLRRLFMVRSRGFAWAALLLLAAGIGHHQYRENARNQVARGVHAFSAVTTVAEPEILEDFDAIREISQARVEVDRTDETLFVLLGQ